MSQDTQINVGMNVEGVVTGVNKAKGELRSLQAEVDKVSKLSKEGGAALVQVGEGVDAEKAVKELSRIAQQIKNVSEVSVNGRNSIEKFTEKLANTGFRPEVYAPLLASFSKVNSAVAQNNAAFTQSGKVMTEYGMGVKATSAALRQVPAQFTDIIVSLQGGQAPLTVLLQQGGQLKDVFGGVGNAFKALSSYVIGLINPFTLLAAAAGAVGYAYYQASAEIDAYNKSLILSGNVTGVTVGQLQAMSKTVSASTGASMGATAEALAQMAGSGKVAQGSLEALTESAIRFEKYAGVAVKDTVKAFSDLAKDPVAASVELNKQFNYLTASVYEQIKALTEQGDKLGASALAQGEYASAQRRMANELESNLGRIEQALNLVYEKANKAWSAVKGLFSTNSIDVEIAALQQMVDNGGGMYNSMTGQSAKNQERLDYLKHLKASQDDYNKSQQQQAQNTAAQIVLDEKYDKTLDKQARMRKEIAQLAGQFNNGVGLNPEQVDKYAKAIQGIVDGYKDTGKAAKGAATTITEAEKGLKLYTDLMDKGAGFTATWAEDANKLRAALDGGAISQSQFAEAIGELYAKQPVVVAATKAQAEAQKELNKALDEFAKANSKALSSAQDEVDKAQESYDAHDKLKSVLQEEALARLENWRIITAMGGEDTGVIDAQIAAKKKLIEILQKGEVRKAGEDAAKDMLKEQKKAAEESGKYWEDALMRAFESGKSFFQSLWDTIKNTLKTQVLKVLVQGTMGTLGIGAAGAANAGGGSDIFGLAGTASTLSNMYSAGASILTIGSQVAAGTMGIANALGTMAANATGTGISGLLATNGAFGTAAAGTASATAGTMSSYLAAIPGWGWAVLGAAAIAAWVSGNGGTPTQGTGQAALTYDNLGNVTDTQQKAEWGGLSPRALASISSMEAAYLAGARSLGIKAASAQFSFGSNTGENSQGNNFALGVNAGSKSYASAGEIVYSDAAMQLEASRAVFTALQGSELPKYLAGVFDGITASTASQEQLDAAISGAQALKAFNDTLLMMPAHFQAVADMSFAATQSLIAFSGGMDKLQANLGTYYTNFYSAEEQRAQTITNINKVTAGSGLDAATATRDSFRALVEAQDLTTESGQKTYAALLSVSGAFAELYPLASSSSAAVKTVVMGVKEFADALKSVDDAQIAATDALRALSDYGKTLGDNVNALRGQAVANRDAAVSAFSQALTAAESYYDGLVKQQEQLNADINNLRGQAGQALTAAGSAAQSALRTIADANDAAQASLQSALKSVVNTITQAADDIKTAQAGVDSAKANITAGYVAANDRVIAAQKALTDAQTQSASALKTAANDLFASLRAIKNANVALDYTSQKNSFEAIAAKALSGDAQAIGQLGAAGSSYLTASSSGASTAAQYQRDDIRIRQVIGQVAQQYGGTVAATDSTSQLAQNLADAVIEMARWTSAVETSGASKTVEQTDLLAQYNAALAALSTAQDSQTALLAATSTLDLSGIQTSTYAWGDAVDAATAAQSAATSATNDLATALSAASAAGVSLTDIVTPLQNLSTAITALQTAQSDYDAVQGDLYTAAAGLVEQYTTLNTDLTTVGADITSTRASIDASVTAFDALGLSVPSAITALESLATSLLDVQTANSTYATLLASSYAPPDTLLQQYADATAALADFTTRTNTVDFSGLAVLDPLGTLLQTYADAVATLTGAQAAVQQSYFDMNPDVAAAYAQNSSRNSLLGNDTTIEGLYNKYLGRASDAAGAEYWKNIFGDIIDAKEIATFLVAAQPEIAVTGGLGNLTKDEYAALHYSLFGINEQRVNPNLLKPVGLAIGTNYVPYDGFAATLHQGEAVIPAAYNPAAGGQARDEAVVAEIKALRAELAAMRLDNRAASNTIADNTSKTAKSLDGVINGGNTLNVAVAA